VAREGVAAAGEGDGPAQPNQREKREPGELGAVSEPVQQEATRDQDEGDGQGAARRGGMTYALTSGMIQPCERSPPAPFQRLIIQSRAECPRAAVSWALPVTANK